MGKRKVCPRCFILMAEFKWNNKIVYYCPRHKYFTGDFVLE